MTWCQLDTRSVWSYGEHCQWWPSDVMMKREWVNSSWPSGAMWQLRSGSTLAQVMASCLMAPSHYLNQYWLIISEVVWHSPEGGQFLRICSIYLWYEFENYQHNIIVTCSRDQWVNSKTVPMTWLLWIGCQWCENKILVLSYMTSLSRKPCLTKSINQSIHGSQFIGTGRCGSN